MLDTDGKLFERIDALAVRFGWLLATLSDELLPAYCATSGEPVGPVIETLDGVKRRGLIESANAFLAACKLCNHRLVHEYVEDRNEPAANLGAAHAFVRQRRSARDNVPQAIGRLPEGNWSEAPRHHPHWRPPARGRTRSHGSFPNAFPITIN